MAWLPDRLAETPNIVWRTPLSNQALSGVAATSELVVVADRDAIDAGDVFRCLDAATGQERWKLRYPAKGQLDYGNSPRATPLVHGERVIVCGALGQVHCLALADGRIVWKKDLARQFAGEQTPWGWCSSPLVVDGKLIVNPGGPAAGVVALDVNTGEVAWKCPGEPAAYSSFVLASFGGKRQIVGYDKTSLGGWDPASGARLWRLVPPNRNDFNVPTPIVLGERLLVSTENNGTRLYACDSSGQITPQPLARNVDLSPDCHTAVVVGQRVYGVWSGLHCLDLANGLSTVWTDNDLAYSDYCSLVASDTRLLATSKHGELILYDLTGVEPRRLGRLKVFADDAGVLSHPALVGTRLYLRGSDAIVCVELGK